MKGTLSRVTPAAFRRGLSSKHPLDQSLSSAFALAIT